MQVDVVVTAKLTKRVFCAKFRVVDGALLFYTDAKMTQMVEGFKTWRRFNVIEDVDATPIKLTPVDKSKNKKEV